MSTDLLVTKWVLDTVKEKYKDDIALVLSHNTLSINENEDTVAYFIPITDKGRSFAQTFILGGIGYDIWGIEWERMEKFASLEEYNITVLADAKILYARSPEDAARFETLKEKQLLNLKDETISRKFALDAYSTAKYLFTELLFAERSNIRLLSGYVLDYLSRALAFKNHTYFKHSQVNQLEELKKFEKIPNNFCENYLKVLKTENSEERISLCKSLIETVREFLLEDKNEAKEKNFQDLSNWYAELSYTWLRIRHYAEKNDGVKVHMWAIVLQNELNDVCSDFGLPKMELLEHFSFDNLSYFAEKATEFEKEMRNIITSHGAIIRDYNSVEEL